MPPSADFSKLKEQVEKADQRIRASAAQGADELKAMVDDARTKADARAAQLSTKAEEAGDKLTLDEVLVMLRLLLIAGNETTTNLIGNGMLALLRHPDQLQKLRAHPDLMDTAVEEMLRYDTAVQLDFRTALENVEIGGQRITKGQGIMLLLGAANHDPDVFHAPEQFDITRREASHLSFGRGIHHCLGHRWPALRRVWPLRASWNGLVLYAC